MRTSTPAGAGATESAGAAEQADAARRGRSSRLRADAGEPEPEVHPEPEPELELEPEPEPEPARLPGPQYYQPQMVPQYYVDPTDGQVYTAQMSPPMATSMGMVPPGMPMMMPQMNWPQAQPMMYGAQAQPMVMMPPPMDPRQQAQFHPQQHATGAQPVDWQQHDWQQHDWQRRPHSAGGSSSGQGGGGRAPRGRARGRGRWRGRGGRGGEAYLDDDHVGLGRGSTTTHDVPDLPQDPAAATWESLRHRIAALAVTRSGGLALQAKLVNADGTPNAQVVTEVLDALDPTLDRNGEKTFLELIHHPRGSYLTRALVTACSSEQR